MTTRKAIGKRLRFSIFARDGFTCRYCGRQSDAVELHVDHIVPVVSGGTNDESNLITACVDCNLGKAGRAPTFTQPTEADRLRAAQEFHEQKGAAERAREALRVAKSLDGDLVDIWCDVFDQPSMLTGVLPHLRAMFTQHGPEETVEILTITARACFSSNDHDRMRYAYGVRRKRHPEYDVRDRNGTPNERGE